LEKPTFEIFNIFKSIVIGIKLTKIWHGDFKKKLLGNFVTFLYGLHWIFHLFPNDEDLPKQMLIYPLNHLATPFFIMFPWWILFALICECIL